MSEPTYYEPTRRRQRRERHTRPAGWTDPTPEQIREACREIQSEWTDDDRQRRQVYKPTAWQVPTTNQRDD